MSPVCHLVSSSVLPFPALVIICLTTIPCFNLLAIGRMKPISNQLLEMRNDKPNYTNTCTLFLSLKLSLWAVRRKSPGNKIPRGRLSQWAQMYSVNLRMLLSTPHHNQQGKVQRWLLKSAEKGVGRSILRSGVTWIAYSPSCQSQNSQVTSCPLSKAVQFAKISQLYNCHCFIQFYSSTIVDEIDLSPFSFPTSFPTISIMSSAVVQN